MTLPATTKELYDAILKDETGASITIPYSTLSHLIWYSESVGVRRICDKHTQVVKDMRKRADSARYHNVAHAVIGDKKLDLIYDGSYADADEFGSWETNL